MPFLLGTFIQSFQGNAFTLLNRFRNVLYKLLVVLLTSSVVLWLSVFLYGTFYYAYMPAVSHIKPVHLQFRWCHDESICSFPTANVTLVKKGQQQLLMRGQQYKVYLDLEMPESPVNQQLGMFMIKIDFGSRSGEVVHTSSRSAMLRYKSSLLQTVTTLFFSPLFLMGSAEEKQLLSVELCEFYEEDAFRPATSVNIEIQTTHIEIYSSQLRIYAHFTGLRYLMFHWPVLSAVIGIGTNLFFLSIVALLSWYRYLISREPHEVIVHVGYDPSKAKNIEERRNQVKDFLLREKQRQARMRASFSSFDSIGTGRSQLSEDTMIRTHSLEALPLLLPKDSKEASASAPSLFPMKRKESTLSKLVTSDDRRKKFSMQSGKSSLSMKYEQETNSAGTADDESSVDSLENDIVMVTSEAKHDDKTQSKIFHVAAESEEDSPSASEALHSPRIRKRAVIQELH